MAIIYDVIISGAGPGGSMAGYFLGKSGLKVLVIDKCKFPRLKVCAGGLPPHLKKYNFDLNGILESQSNKVIYSYKGKDKVELEFGDFTIDMIMRKNFDLLLLDRAKQQNCIISENEVLLNGNNNNGLIEISTNKNKYKTKYLIGADGALSSTNRIFNIVKKDNIGVTINAEVKLKPEIFENYDRTVFLDLGNCKNGYFWSFPKKEHISIGMGSTNKKYNNFKKIFFKNFKNIGIKETDILEISEIKGAPLPFFLRKEKLNKGNILLIGDAANLVDTLSGEGIFYAIRSGELAAQTIIDCEKNKLPIDNYNILLNDIINNLEYSKKFANIFFKFPKISYILGVKNKTVNNLFKEMIIGNKSYKELYITLKQMYSKKFKNMVMFKK